MTLGRLAELIHVSTFNRVAQLSHFGWGLAIVLLGARWDLALPFTAAWIVYVTLKEFWWDECYELPDERGSSVEDFCFATAGAAVGLGVTRWL